MKSLITISITTLAMCVLCACTDERENNMVNDTFYIKGTETLRTVSVFAEGIDLHIIKAGKGTLAANVRISTPDTCLARYNAENGTDYSSLPSELYRISAEDLSFGKEEVTKPVRLSWTPSAVAKVLEDKEYVIPCLISSDNLEISRGQSLVLIRPLLSTVGFEKAVEGKLRPSASPAATDTYGAFIKISYPVPDKDVTLTLTMDNTLVETFNSENGTTYSVAPDGLVALASDKVTIAAGSTGVDLKYTLVGEKFYKDGMLVPFTSYLVPIRITSVSLDGMGIGQDVLFIPIVYEEDEIKGPWAVLEGANQCYGNEEGRPNWAAKYLVDRMVDGDPTTEWISQWEHPNTFPMTFVFDMGSFHLFSLIKIQDHSTYQGNYRDFAFYVADTYSGEQTQWQLIASGERGYEWVPGGKLYDFPVQNMIPGRYLKMVILKCREYYEGGSGRGKLSEVYGIGL